MIAGLAILKRAWPYLVGALLILAWAYMGYRHGVTTTSERYERMISEQLLANTRALAEAQDKARQVEQQAAKAQADIETAYLKGQQDAQAITDRTISDLRADRIRLRSELTSARCTLAGVSDITTGTGQRDAACTGGLREQDALFLIRFADRADQVARQLQAAQAIIAADRAAQTSEAVK